MTISKVNSNLPITTKISNLSDQILEIFGLVQQAKFDQNEIQQLTDDFGLDRKYLRTQSLGHTLPTYSNWSHLHSESGYSIWSFSPTHYAYNSVNELYLDDVAFENRGLANSESVTTFDSVFLYNGSTYVDNTTEAGTENGSSFDLLADTNDYLYIGLSTTFAGVSFEFDVRGSNNTLYMEYWNGSVWTDLDISANTFVDDTSNFESDGRIYWTIPSNWATTTINSVSKYWVRISTTTTPVTTAKAFLIQPANSVISLLQMSSEEIFNEDWAWCSYGSSIYVTIRNAGVSAYEGNYYITSSSSSINKQNYFIHNHEFTADYEDSTYTHTTIESQLNTSLIPFDYSLTSATNFYDAMIEIYDLASSGTTVYGLPLTQSGTQIRFNYDTVTLDLDGNNLRVKSGVWQVAGSYQSTLVNSAGLSTAIGGDVAVVDGGTGKSSWTEYLIPYADTTTSFSQIAIGSSGQVLTSRGNGYSPIFQPISLTLDDLSNVSVLSGITTGQLLVYGTDYWENKTFTSVIEFIIDGGGSAITTGIKGDLEIPFPCTITRVTMLADTSGSIVVDIWKDSYQNFAPTDADSITSATPPTITSGINSQNSTLTNWITSISTGSVLRYNVDSCTSITRCTISLYVNRSL